MALAQRIDASEPRDDDDAPHVLIVDDDQRIRSLLERFLRKEGYRISSAENANQARRKLEGFVFDALVLDVMMPGEDGFSLLETLRADGNATMPILMLTARTEPDQRIHGLELGADDYLGKPFEPRELALRLSNLMRRRPETHRFVRFGRFVFDVRREELSADGDLVRLTDRERRLMRLFASRPGATIPRHELVADEDLGDRAIDVQINRLRRKLEDDPAEPKYLQTMRGLGYRLLADPGET
ncbi:response regulator transcription factor [Acuticoccus sp. M5D2P5]|uniref:response regulator n=1 Tax=Acuticoccus kalidii TaxID=2910977 RepID=UPI001F2B8F59|nr:response regulator transcription factor [Acuticoccus kalidii]MCF3931876.1 response regulator transcription factor [Acuticoccus kalidii]